MTDTPLHPRFIAKDDEVDEILSQLEGDTKTKDAFLSDTIRKLDNGKYQLVSGTGKNLGTFDSKAEAEQHEREVQFFKHKTDGL